MYKKCGNCDDILEFCECGNWTPVEWSFEPAGYDAIRVKNLIGWLERQAEEAAKNADVFKDNRSEHLLEEMNFRAAAEIIKATS